MEPCYDYIDKNPTYDCRLQAPFNLIISGATQSGKTTFACNLLKSADELITKQKSDYVLLYYKAQQPKYDRLISGGLVHETINLFGNEAITYNDVLEKVEHFKDGKGSTVIFDDAMSFLNKDLADVFTTLGHHTNTNLIFMTQNLFYDNPFFRTISLNSHYMSLLKNKRDLQQISTIARQICPKNQSYIADSYTDATKRPYGHLFIDFHPNSDDKILVRGNIFSHQPNLEDKEEEYDPMCVYLKKE